MNTAFPDTTISLCPVAKVEDAAIAKLPGFPPILKPFDAALADGDLVDVSREGRAVALTCPVFITRALSERVDDIPTLLRGDTRVTRLLGVLLQIVLRLRFKPGIGDHIKFDTDLPVKADEPLPIDIDDYPTVSLVAGIGTTPCGNAPGQRAIIVWMASEDNAL